MSRRMNPGIILLLLCVCSSSLSSGWPSLVSSLAVSGVTAFGGDDNDKDPTGGLINTKKECIISEDKASYKTEECYKFLENKPEWVLGLQGGCKQGDTMVGYNGTGCSADYYKAVCMNGPPGGTWTYEENSSPECEVPVPKDTGCKVTLYTKKDFEDDEDVVEDTLELNRSLYTFDAPYGILTISSVKAEGETCGKVLLHSNHGFGGNQHNVLTAGDDANKELSGEWKSITINAA